MPIANIVEFALPFQGTLIVGDRWMPPHPRHTALLLHGGGASAAEGFRELRTFLHAQHIATVAFDAVGHGRTGGRQLGTTLEERVQQVVAVLKSEGLDASTLTLVGFSMGAYVGAKAAAELGVSRLCLAIPAAYAARAYRVPFGPQFTEILRTPRSWEHSDAFELLDNYLGHLLVISAEEDSVVPAEIPRKYVAAARNCATVKHVVVRRAGHTLSEHYEREPQSRAAVYSEIASLCQRGHG